MTKAKGGESYFAAEAIVLKSVKDPNIQQKGKAFQENIIKTAHAIFKDLVHCIERGLDPASDEVQRIIKKHHTFAEHIHNASQEVYKAMAQLYQEHPDFRKQIDPFHPQLAELMAQAMRIFADQNL